MPYVFAFQDEDDEKQGEAIDSTDASGTGNNSEEDENDGSDLLVPNSDDCISPVAKLERYSISDNIFSRQMVARSILETLRGVVQEQTQVDTILAVISRLSDDSDPTVRSELMEQVPHIAVFCHEERGVVVHVVIGNLLPLVVKFLIDSNSQVRKTTQAALLVLMEQDLITRTNIEEQVCPVLLRLTEFYNVDECRVEAAALMSKLAPLVGREMTLRLFLDTFANLCEDQLFHVRKVCASNFGEICTVVGNEATEEVLIQHFFELCRDGVWGVRKACADVFMVVSCACLLKTRREFLSPIFILLLQDQSRWVRMAAFQTLGPFISTFANTHASGFYYTEDGELVGVLTQLQEQENSSDVINEMIKQSQRNTSESEITVDCTQREEVSETNSSQISVINNVINPIDSNNTNEINDNTSSNSTNDEETSPISFSQDLNSNIVPNQDIVMDISNIDDATNVIEGDKLSFEEQRAKDYAFDHLIMGTVVRNDCGDANNPKCDITTGLEGSVHIHFNTPSTNLRPESDFNTFQFWRSPIPDIQLDIDMVKAKPANVHVKARVFDEVAKKMYSSEINVNLDLQNRGDQNVSTSYVRSRNKDVTTSNISFHSLVTALKDVSESSSDSSSDEESTQINSDLQASIQKTKAIIEEVVADVKSSYSQSTGRMRRKELSVTPPNHQTFSMWKMSGLDNIHSQDIHYQSPVASPLLPNSLRQTIVPQLLIDHFISMTDPSHAQMVDNEIARHCAFSLPAVALTLGRRNWPLLKKTYEALAADMQWKVRRTLAASIHEVAMILGEELASQDLIPIFNDFIKDLDEVRIGVLKHLSHFIRLLKPAERHEYLEKLDEFLKMDNDRNWRYRLELTEQLLLLVPLFEPLDVKKYLVPIAMALVRDKVAAVRQTALLVITKMLSHLSTNGDMSLVKSFLSDLAEEFAHSQSWIGRQLFAFLCNHIISDQAIPIEQFAQDLLPHLIDLSWDKVPNVRIAVARILSQSILKFDYFSNSPHYDILLETLCKLQQDKDRDVVFFAQLNLIKETNIIMERSESPDISLHN